METTDKVTTIKLNGPIRTPVDWRIIKLSGLIVMIKGLGGSWIVPTALEEFNLWLYKYLLDVINFLEESNLMVSAICL